MELQQEQFLTNCKPIKNTITGDKLKSKLDKLSVLKDMRQRVDLRKVSLRKREETSKRSRKFDALWKTSTPHIIDKDILGGFYLGKPKHQDVFGDFDVSFDGVGGFYFIKWYEEDIEMLNRWMISRSFGIIRYCRSNGSAFLEELEWYCSQHFDDVCMSIDLDANKLRIELPMIIARYHKSIPKEAQLIVNDFIRLKPILAEDVPSLYETEDHSLSVDWSSLNESSSYEDLEHISECIEVIENDLQAAHLIDEKLEEERVAKKTAKPKKTTKVFRGKERVKRILADIKIRNKQKLATTISKKATPPKVKRMPKKENILNDIATDLLLAAETLEELYGKVGQLTAFKVELLSSKAKEIVSVIKKAKFILDTEAVDLSNLALVLKEFCEKEDRKVSFKMGLVADKVISLSAQLDKL